MNNKHVGDSSCILEHVRDMSHHTLTFIIILDIPKIRFHLFNGVLSFEATAESGSDLFFKNKSIIH